MKKVSKSWFFSGVKNDVPFILFHPLWVEKYYAMDEPSRAEISKLLLEINFLYTGLASRLGVASPEIDDGDELCLIYKYGI